MKKGVVSALLVFLSVLFVLGLVFPKHIGEGFVPGDARPKFAPCMNDQECSSNKCSQGKCV